MFQWNEEYKMNVDEIDIQHKKLFEIGNRAYQVYKSIDVLNRHREIVEILNELKAYIIYHFSCEEAYLINIQSDNLDNHKRAHKLFIDRVEALIQELKDMGENREYDEETTFIAEILYFIFEWIDMHILKVDVLYAKK